MTEMTPEQRAVLEAARAWAAIYEDIADWDDYAERGGAARQALLKAVHRLDSDGGVRPETLPPGTRFIWAGDASKPDTPSLLLISVSGVPHYLAGNTALPFEEDDRVIPLQEPAP